MPFCKLDSEITKSSIWSEPLHVRVVWISFLAEKDEDGFVAGTRSGLIRLCNVPAEQFDDAVKILESPDGESRTPDYEGRRVEKCNGGWMVLNHEMYRLPEQEKKLRRNEYQKDLMAKRRAKEKLTNANNELTDANNELTSVSVSESVSTSESVNDCSYIDFPATTIPPTIEAVKYYCFKANRKIDIDAFFDYHGTRGWYLKAGLKMRDWHRAIGTFWNKEKKTYEEQYRLNSLAVAEGKGKPIKQTAIEIIKEHVDIDLNELEDKKNEFFGKMASKMSNFYDVDEFMEGRNT